jgi:hypothetical protein
VQLSVKQQPPSATAARIETAVEKGLEAFWAAVVEEFPEVTSGDFDAMEEGFMYSQCATWIEMWLSFNGPTPA